VTFPLQVFDPTLMHYREILFSTAI